MNPSTGSSSGERSPSSHIRGESVPRVHSCGRALEQLELSQPVICGVRNVVAAAGARKHIWRREDSLHPPHGSEAGSHTGATPVTTRRTPHTNAISHVSLAAGPFRRGRRG